MLLPCIVAFAAACSKTSTIADGGETGLESDDDDGTSSTGIDPMPDPPPTTSGGTGSTGGEADTGQGGCADNTDCALDDVCFDGDCEDAWAHSYELRVLSFQECPVDGFGAAEVYYKAYNPELITTSSVSVCPPSWPNDVVDISAFDGAFQINFIELDEFFDDPITSLCWDTFGLEECGPVPKIYLNYGLVYECWGNADEYCAEFEFTIAQ